MGGRFGYDAQSLLDKEIRGNRLYACVDMVKAEIKETLWENAVT